MAARGALADRVRVSHTNHGDLGSYGACDEGGQEGVHGACACRSSTACLGCALLRAPAAGLARARPRRGCSRRRVRGGTALQSYARRRRAGRWGRHGNDTNLQHYRSVRVCETGASQSASLGRRRVGTASGRNRGSTTAMQEQSIWGCSPSSRGFARPPGVTPRARAPVAAPRSTPAPRLPATAASRKLRLPAAPLPELPHS